MLPLGTLCSRHVSNPCLLLSRRARRRHAPALRTAFPARGEGGDLMCGASGGARTFLTLRVGLLWELICPILPTYSPLLCTRTASGPAHSAPPPNLRPPPARPAPLMPRPGTAPHRVDGGRDDAALARRPGTHGSMADPYHVWHQAWPR